jgi:hypothetical protein
MIVKTNLGRIYRLISSKISASAISYSASRHENKRLAHPNPVKIAPGGHPSTTIKCDIGLCVLKMIPLYSAADVRHGSL